LFEHRAQSLLPRRAFIVRLVQYGGFAVGIVLASLAIGVIGYRISEGMSWTDATLNAAMILGGMGPVNELHTEAGKLFATFYALFAGVVFLIAVGVLVSPIAHRFYHRFHLELEEEKAKRR
jgi:hypothetical protein